MSKTDTPNIHRSKHDSNHPYFCINRDVAQNTDLSFAARGMLAYILSKPDDWQITLTNLTNANPGGRDATRTVWNELIAYGYIVPGLQARVKGRFANATPHQCYESPRTENPSTDNQELENRKRSTSNRQPVTENPTEQSTDNKVQKQSKNTLSVVTDAKPKKAKPKPRKQDFLFNAIADVCFEIEDPSKIGKRGGRIGKVKKVLVEAFPNIQPEDIYKFKGWYRKEFPGLPLPRDPDKVLEHYIAFNESFTRKEKVIRISEMPGVFMEDTPPNMPEVVTFGDKKHG